MWITCLLILINVFAFSWCLHDYINPDKRRPFDLFLATLNLFCAVWNFIHLVS